MNRATAIKKLGNAIRAYKGTRHSVNGPFVIQPQPSKAKRIKELLAILHFDGEEQTNAITTIDGFKTYDDYNNWINKLRN